MSLFDSLQDIDYDVISFSKKAEDNIKYYPQSAARYIKEAEKRFLQLKCKRAIPHFLTTYPNCDILKMIDILSDKINIKADMQLCLKNIANQCSNFINSNVTDNNLVVGILDLWAKCLKEFSNNLDSPIAPPPQLPIPKGMRNQHVFEEYILYILRNQDESIIQSFLELEFTQRYFDIKFPLLNEDGDIKDACGHDRYWVDAYNINGKYYWACSEWWPEMKHSRDRFIRQYLTKKIVKSY